MDAVKPRLIQGPSTTERAWSRARTIADMPCLSAQDLVSPQARLVVVAPHPDDEILMAGGLLQQLLALGRRAVVVAVTDGEASHPQSSIWPAGRLLQERPLESQAAIRRLAASACETRRLGLPDGRLRDHASELRTALSDIVVATDVVLTTWRLDGHPDHDTCGDQSAAVAAGFGAILIEAPVWMWHWSTPADPRVPWARARRLQLSARQIERKRDAVSAFSSQLEADTSTGAGPVLSESVLCRVARPDEVYFVN